MSLFVPNVEYGWDKLIHCSSLGLVDGKYKLDWLQLDQPLPCGDELIPIGFKWNGASVGPLRRIFPKWKHPIATCRHDRRCEEALTVEERLFADQEFKRDVLRGGTRWEANKGYMAVRLGAKIKQLKGQLI
jgi:hypothetical protein